MPGLVVVELNPTGQAAKLGILEYDVLFKCNGAILDVVENLTSQSSEKAENELIVIRGKNILHFVYEGALGVSLMPYPLSDMVLEGVGGVLSELCRKADAETKMQQQNDEGERLSRTANVQITTAQNLEGYRVAKTLDIVTAEYVGGINMFRDLFAIVTDLVGGRSTTMQNELRKAKETCLANLKIEADLLGANAVIAVKLDYSEISGGGKSMLFLVASGTAVIVE